MNRLRWRVLIVLALVGTVTAETPLPSDSASAAEVSPADRQAIRAELAKALAAGQPILDRFDAEVWLTAVEPPLMRFLPREDERLALLGEVWAAAVHHQMDPDLAMALIEVESSFNRYAISSAGAQGLMQVMPFWKQEIGRPEDNLTDMSTNIRYGMTIFAHYLERESGDTVRALTRYHGNRRDLSYPERVYRAWNARWRTRHTSEVQELLSACYRAGLRYCD